jgi:hypothetical protein
MHAMSEGAIKQVFDCNCRKIICKKRNYIMKNIRTLNKLTLALATAGIVVSLPVLADRHELRGPHGGPPSFPVLLEKFDADNDNVLSKDEVPVPVWNHLSAADLDKNGSVTETEFNEAAPEK